MTGFEMLRRSILIGDGGIQSVAIGRTKLRICQIFCNLSHNFLEIFTQKQSFWAMPR
jgi:hypothetical protein